MRTWDSGDTSWAVAKSLATSAGTPGTPRALPEARIEHLMEIACRFGIKATLLGRVKRDRFRIKGWKFSLDVDLKKMRETYQGSLSSYFR